MSNVILPCELTIVIPRHPCLLRMANAVSLTVEQVNSVTSDPVNLFTFVMWAVANKCFPIELVPCSDGWQRTQWQMIHMMPRLAVSSIQQCEDNRHEGACWALFQALGRFESTYIQAHQASNMICKVRSLKSRIKKGLFLKEIITSSNEVFKDVESDMVVWNRQLGDPTWRNAESNDTTKQAVGS